MAEKFSLKWNDYISNVTKKFSSLRNEDDFYDVTLVSSDKRQVSAHKVVLSSCSDYFKTVLKNNNKTSNTILCLENIYFEELNQMLDYVYNGEVSIDEDKLTRFLTIAQRFQLEGLLSVSDGSEEYQREQEESTYVSEVNQQQNETHFLSKIEDVEDKLKSHVTKEKIIFSSEKFHNIEELNEKIKENILRLEGTKRCKCKICNKLSRDFTDAQKHVEIHFDGLSFPCQSCGKTFRSRNALRQHKYIYTQCNKTLF